MSQTLISTVLVFVSIMWYTVSMIKINQKSYFEVQFKESTNTSSNLLNNNELVDVNYYYEQFSRKGEKEDE